MTATNPQLLLLPGLDGSAQLFSWFVAQMPPGQRWNAVSYPADAPADWDALAEIAEATVAKNCKVVIVAESFSGPVAMRLLSRKHIDITGCAFVASFARAPNPLLQLGRVIPISIVAPFKNSETALKVGCVGGDASDAVVQQLKSVLGDLPLATLKARFDLLRVTNERAALLGSDVPKLYLRAKRDRLVVGGCSKDFLAAPNCDVHEIDGPHFLLQTHPAECWRLISAWLHSIASEG